MGLQSDFIIRKKYNYHIMAGKCNILKPVDSLTGTFFMFSQYAEDLTKQYSAPDTYRCLPSKFIALNLDFGSISGSTKEETSKTLGNIFQNYFENACTFLRGVYTSNKKDFSPEYTKTLLFQTLEKYNMLSCTDTEQDNGETTTDEVQQSRGAISGITKNVQYIGDINIYSNIDESEDGVGYNEIYCYIPNDAKCYNYKMIASSTQDIYDYTSTKICGYENESPYNGLTYLVDGFCDNFTSQNGYGIGSYSDSGSPTNVLVPQCLEKNSDSDDVERSDVDSYPINAIIVLYDIYKKDASSSESYALYENIPMGIYFTGMLDENKEMTNTITKYITSETVYNQGTSYGLRVCTRFLAQPNSTVTIHSIDAQGSTNVSEMTPVLQKMAETLAGVEEILDDHSAMQKLLNDHLANFKNNKVNVPYVRQLGTKKYWFVNGKNTGAVAQFEMTDSQDLILQTAQKVLELVYTKEQVNNKLSNYVLHSELNESLNGLITKDALDSAINNLESKLLTYLQSE